MRTSLYSILCIVVRLGAVFLAFGMLSNVPAIAALWTRSMATEDIVVTLGFVTVVVLFAVALWIYPGFLARIAAGRSSEQVFESPIAPAELQWIAMSVLGMYFLLSAVAALASYGVHWLMMSLANETFDGDKSQLVSDTLYWVIQMVFGIVLVLGARGLVGWLRRFRERGLPVARFDDDTPDAGDPQRSA